MLLEKRSARRGHPDDPTLYFDQSSIARILPNRELGTGRTPGSHHFLIGPGAFADPDEKIENQCFYDRISHIESTCRLHFTQDDSSRPGVPDDSLGGTVFRQLDIEARGCTIGQQAIF